MIDSSIKAISPCDKYILNERNEKFHLLSPHRDTELLSTETHSAVLLITQTQVTLKNAL